MAMQNTDILLIVPPFGTISNLYLSIPVLASYLKSRDMRVSAYDMRREFYVKLLTPQNILAGIGYAKTRFCELNDKPQLNFSELFEYEKLSTILLGLSKFKREIEQLCYPFADFSDIQNSKAIFFFIRAATLPHFPEMIIPEYSYRELSAYNPLSTSDILEASVSDKYSTRIFEEIIVEQIVQQGQPFLIGFSVVFTNQIIPAFQCARIIKKYLPDTHIVLGGPCISTYFRELHEKKIFTFVDSFVLDEGEIPLEILSKELLKETTDLSQVPGLIYLSDHEIRFNSPATPLSMELSPPPDYTIFQIDKYIFTRNGLMAPVRSSKGCSWQKCTFCRTALPICKDFEQAPEEFVYQQFVDVVRTSGLSYWFFSDENANPKVLEYISRRLLEEKIRLHWIAHTRISQLLTKERCRLYRDAGCIGLRVGIESFSDRVLKLMKKGTTVQLIENVLEELEGGVPLTAYMMVGFPTETEKEALAGYEKLQYFLSKRLIRNYDYAVFCLLYGSDIYNHPARYGISDIRIPDGSDLCVDIIDFTSTGMSREKAYQLQAQFNHPADLRKASPVQTVRADSKAIPVRYNLREIEALISRKNFTILPFVQWLSNTDEIVSPGIV